MNLQSKFGYCIITQTLNIALCLEAGRNYRQTDGWTDKQTDGRTIRLLDAPGGPFRPGALNKYFLYVDAIQYDLHTIKISVCIATNEKY